MKLRIYTVELQGGTTGKLYSKKTENQLLGLWVEVVSHDQNGNSFYTEGIVEEVLEIQEQQQ